MTVALAAHPDGLTIGRVQDLVAEHFGFTVAQLKSPRRTADLVLARQIAMWLSRTVLSSRSLPQIGRAFCRDHTTIMHAVEVIDRMREADHELAADIDRLRDRLVAEAVLEPVRVTAIDLAEHAAAALRQALLESAGRDPALFVGRLCQALGLLDLAPAIVEGGPS